MVVSFNSSRGTMEAYLTSVANVGLKGPYLELPELLSRDYMSYYRIILMFAHLCDLY